MNRNRIPWDLCIVSNKKAFHSSIHRQAGKQINKTFARAYFPGETIDDEENEESEKSLEAEAQNVEEDSESYISSTRFTAAMSLAPG